MNFLIFIIFNRLKRLYLKFSLKDGYYNTRVKLILKIMKMKIDYHKILKKNLECVLHDVLKIIEKNGLKENQHLYITFNTQTKNVKIPKWLLKKYPKEMTIVIQYEYSYLIVKNNFFSINLSFENINAKLSIPFCSIISFADPYSKFGLQLIKQKASNNKSSNSKNKIIKLDNYRKN